MADEASSSTAGAVGTRAVPALVPGTALRTGGYAASAYGLPARAPRSTRRTDVLYKSYQQAQVFICQVQVSAGTTSVEYNRWELGWCSHPDLVTLITKAPEQQWRRRSEPWDSRRANRNAAAAVDSSSSLCSIFCLFVVTAAAAAEYTEQHGKEMPRAVPRSTRPPQ
ncbi:hypothetical protein TGAM01_v204969 [Trichoderma gamsii]|uniref:Uncharacterized protein n=1 Tax=Trichoderma gamsii TaxID=398673 RepID=A0A2P4ZP12_9HYPO|nr:hypothetical protein TGAM01_v204969 [Trichoderma gamsii]PON26025.1 hypothetical protein TGAM01_v204969 [Trichoderma gamsii]